MSTKIGIEIFRADFGRHLETRGFPSPLGELRGIVNVIWTMSEVKLVMLTAPLGLANFEIQNVHI